MTEIYFIKQCTYWASWKVMNDDEDGDINEINKGVCVRH